MAAYRRVFDSRHLQADCQEPGSAPEPYGRQWSIGYLYIFISSSGNRRTDERTDTTDSTPFAVIAVGDDDDRQRVFIDSPRIICGRVYM